MSKTTYQCVACDATLMEHADICPFCSRQQTIRSLLTSQLPRVKPKKSVGALIKAAKAEDRYMSHNERIDYLRREIVEAAGAGMSATIPPRFHKFVLDMLTYYRLDDEEDF